jgi:hypothetical protein
VYYFFGVVLIEGIRLILQLKLTVLIALERMLLRTVSEEPVEGHVAMKVRLKKAEAKREVV